MLQKIDGIVIKTQDYGESNKILTIFSGKIGKFSAIARGAKKSRSRMVAVSQPFINASFFVYVNKGLSTIQQGEIIDSFRPIREDIIKTSYAAYVSELTDKLLEIHTPDLYLYQQFYFTMEWIKSQEEVEIPIIMYELKLYQSGGFAPVLDRCVSCGNNEHVHVHFSIREGGLLCNQCKRIDDQCMALPIRLAKLLPIFLHVGLEKVGSISVKPENIQLLRKILNAYYDQFGGYYLKSRKFLSQLDKLK